MIVGLCGKYCSGKNAAAKIFEEKGFQVIDVDKLGHETLDTAKDRIVSIFGAGVLGKDDKVDRKKLGSIVFSDSRKLKDLEVIVHPVMVETARRIIAESDKPVVINAALLFTMKLHELCDSILIIHAPLLQRINRAIERDGLGILDILKRIFAQRKLIPQPSLLPADTIVMENRETHGVLREKISAFITRLNG